MTSPAPPSTIRLGRFTMLPGQGRVMLDGKAVRLGSRAVDLLHALAVRHGEVVGKDELLHKVWPGLVVEENNLHVQVSALRKLLGHNAIVTVPGRGYALDSSLDVQQEPYKDPVRPKASRAEVLPPLRGRSVEAATLRKLIREHRIVTVVGPGGVGKTRLVREVLADDDEVPLKRIEDSGDRFVAALKETAEAVRQQPAVVVVENAEQAIDSTGEFADGVADVAGVRMVCTSQAPLNARGEHVLRLAPLPIPAIRPGREVTMTPALEVMQDAVTTLQPAFSFDDDSRHEAATICRHLDGLPLAIILAAGRVPLLGVAGVRRRLTDRFYLLSGGPRGTAPRHQSLLAAMEWSWRILTTREREALTTLSRLAGRFTLQAATSALQPVARDKWDAMELLGALVDKSVVLAESPGHTSFRLLESTRLFAMARPPG